MASPTKKQCTYNPLAPKSGQTFPLIVSPFAKLPPPAPHEKRQPDTPATDENYDHHASQARQLETPPSNPLPKNSTATSLNQKVQYGLFIAGPTPALYPPQGIGGGPACRP
jgi:hypothetical protein